MMTKISYSVREVCKELCVQIIWSTKPANSALMHLKSYQIDGRLLRTGAANFDSV